MYVFIHISEDGFHLLIGFTHRGEQVPLLCSHVWLANPKERRQGHGSWEQDSHISWYPAYWCQPVLPGGSRQAWGVGVKIGRNPSNLTLSYTKVTMSNTAFHFWWLIGCLYLNLSPSVFPVLSWGPIEWHIMWGHHPPLRASVSFFRHGGLSNIFLGGTECIPHARCSVATDSMRGLLSKSVVWSWIHFCYGNKPKDMA